MNAPLTRGLAARYYTDPDIYKKEITGLLSITWQFAGHASQLQNPGDYFTFEIAGQNLFAVRDREGDIRTFYNVCQHRAHELVQGSGNSRMLICPYHAWTYELNGKLRAGPNTRAVAGFGSSRICLTEVRNELFHNFIFVNLDQNASPMDDWYPNVWAELAEFVPHIDQLEPLEWMECPERCNWKISVENYSECYHCPTRHPTFVAGVVKPQTYNIQPDAKGGYVLRHTTQCQNLDKMTYRVDLSANPHAGAYQSWFLWPLFSFQCYPGNVLNTYHWRIHAIDRCTVWRGWYTESGVDDPVIRRLALQDRETTVAEDIQLVESVQRGLKSRGYQPAPLVLDPKGGVMSEHALAALQQWVRDAVEH